MRFTRRFLAGLTMITSVVLGLSLTVAGTATAAEGAWRPYGNENPITYSPSTWKCNETRTIDTNVVAQVCAVRSYSGTSTQGAVIVRNNRSGTYVLSASVSLYLYNGGYLNNWYCPDAGIGKHSWSVCFGKTMGKSYLLVYASGAANSVGLGSSPNA